MKRGVHAGAATAPLTSTDLVRGVAAEFAGDKRRRRSAGGLATVGSVERVMAIFLGLYLGWVVARVPEVFPALFVPRLPMILLLVFAVALALGIKPAIWREAWHASLPFRLVCLLGALVVITIPIGIWPSGSFHYAIDRYIIPFVVFLACLLFLRDRQNLRRAVAIYVLAVSAISIKTIRSYDPDQLVETANGDFVPMRELRADQQRVVVSISLDPNDFGAVIATTVPLALWLAAGSFLRRIVWGGTALTMVAAMVPTASRGALLGLIGVALTLVAFGATGWRRSFFLVLIVVSGFLFAAIATQGQLSRFFAFGGDDYNVAGNEGRLFFWTQGMIWMLKRPWGLGIGNFNTYFGWMNGPERAAHSMWVQYGSELGVLGLVTAIGLTVIFIKQLKAMRRSAIAARLRGKPEARADGTLAGHIMAMLVGMSITGSFLSNAYYPLTYMGWGLAAAVLLHHTATTEAEPSAPAPAAPGSGNTSHLVEAALRGRHQEGLPWRQRG
jgi:hypothetical protein